MHLSVQESISGGFMQGPFPPSTPGGHMHAPSQEERVMAALGHASVLIPQIGLIGPLVLWLVNKDKAPYAAYQSQQAFWFQLAINAITWLLVLICVFTLGFGLLVLWPVLLGLPVLSIVYGIIGAVHAYNGRDFRYWIIGDLIKP
jgi:uncharacterized Tic20 family protein